MNQKTKQIIEDTIAKKYPGAIIESVMKISEKAKSKSQQRFFGAVKSAQEKGGDNVSDEVKKAAKSMSKKSVSDFASTKHKGLPEKVKKVKETETPKEPNLSQLGDGKCDYGSDKGIYSESAEVNRLKFLVEYKRK